MDKRETVGLIAGLTSKLKSAITNLEQFIGMGELSPAQIQKIVADGKARDYFSIGDVIYIPWTNYTGSAPVLYDMPFVVVHIGDVYDDQDVKHENALWLMCLYCEPEEMIFDASEEILATEATFTEGWYYYIKNADNSFTEQTVTYGDTISGTYYHHTLHNAANTLRYGYNRWSKSAYRQWLNSAAAKNDNWWTAQYESDVAPSTTYTNKPGWLYGFGADFLDIVKPVKVQTSCNTVTDDGVTDVTYDRFFLPSLEQMYGSPQAASVEGDYWEYWKNVTGLDEPSNGSSSDTNDARKISQINAPDGAAVYVRLRSANYGYSSVWVVSSAGYLTSNNALNAYRSQPACVIY